MSRKREGPHLVKKALLVCGGCKWLSATKPKSAAVCACVLEYSKKPPSQKLHIRYEWGEYVTPRVCPLRLREIALKGRDTLRKKKGGD